MPEDRYYPTITDLVTDTSGYKAHYFERLMPLNFLASKNEYFGVTKEMITKKISSVNISNQNHVYKYSNFDYGVLGFEPKSGTAVVILSNLSPNNRIPATVLGVKYLEEISSE